MRKRKAFLKTIQETLSWMDQTVHQLNKNSNHKRKEPVLTESHWFFSSIHLFIPASDSLHYGPFDELTQL